MRHEIIKKIMFAMLAMMAAMPAMARPHHVIIPRALHPGSKIAIVTPASAIKPEVVEDAVKKIAAQGFVPVVYPHATTHSYGSYPANDSIRAAELMDAFTNPEIDAILCARGGYGCVRLLPMLDVNVIRANPKWLIGYSDISDLHALMHKAGVASIHGPMAGHIASEPQDDQSAQYLYQIISGGIPMSYELPAHRYNRYGKGQGRLLGGNLLTINGLAETPWDVMNPADGEDVILFIEDVGEKIYAIERVLMRMHLDGSLKRLKGLIIGQFSEYSPSADFRTMEDMIHHWLKKWGYYEQASSMPIVFDFPTGHVTKNYPMVCDAWVELTAKPEGTTLKFTRR